MNWKFPRTRERFGFCHTGRAQWPRHLFRACFPSRAASLAWLVSAVRQDAVMNPQDILVPSLPAVLTGVGGYSSAALVYRHKERRALRLSAADSVIPKLLALRHLVRISDRHADGAEWHTAAAAALDAIEAEAHRLPRQWRHLQQSVRIAIGEASGVFAFADRTPYEPSAHPAAYSAEWARNAEDYLTYSLRGLRAWKDDLRARRRCPALVSFDEWLQARNEQPRIGPLAYSRM